MTIHCWGLPYIINKESTANPPTDPQGIGIPFWTRLICALGMRISISEMYSSYTKKEIVRKCGIKRFCRALLVIFLILTTTSNTNILLGSLCPL